jgi:uncharacterized membrane protein
MDGWLLAFLIGVVCGLRPFTGLAAISIAARLDRLGLAGSKIAFLSYRYTPWIFAALALVEYVTDQLPKTPSRKVPQQFIPRLLAGALCGAAMCVAGGSTLFGIFAGIVGAIAGTFGGAKGREVLASAFGKDMPAAFLEDAIAIGLALLVVTRNTI